MGGGGHDDHTLEPPFHRLPLPNRPLPEEDELIWNDRVAPETALDFDAPHISSNTGLLMWLGGFAFFYGVFQFAKSTAHPSNKPTVSCWPRVFCFQRRWMDLILLARACVALHHPLFFSTLCLPSTPHHPL